jgi:hypothetical protein
VVQGLDFFAEVPALRDQMPSAGEASGAAVVLVIRDIQQITSTAIRCLPRYAQILKAHKSVLILADVHPGVPDTLKKFITVDLVGAENVFPATDRVLAAENTAWEAAQIWLSEQEGGTQ